MTEIWKPVVGYESQYQVSSLGNVKSLNKGILMSPSTTPNGYSIINLSNNGRRKCFAIHRLVAQAFLSNYNDSSCKVSLWVCLEICKLIKYKFWKHETEN